MDEADILASRKAILAKGRLKALGSSIFLKRVFGLGYVISAEFENESLVPGDQLLEDVTKMLKKLLLGMMACSIAMIERSAEAEPQGLA